MKSSMRRVTTRANGRERGLGAPEAMVATGIFSVITVASLAFLGQSIDVAADQHADSHLFASGQSALLRMTDDIEEADPLDVEFSVAPEVLVFRQVTGATPSGARTYGDEIRYAIEGPVTVEGGQTSYQLVRTVTDADDVVKSQNVVLTNLTAPDDPVRPSRFAYAPPAVTVELFAHTSGHASDEVDQGLTGSFRLRY